jgi:hypothetical protein
MRCNLQVPEEFQEKYIDILFKHQEAISIDKYDLGMAINYKHRIHLKDENSSRYPRLINKLLNKPWKNG